MKNLKSKVYLIFSDTLMIALALLIIPVIIAQNFLHLTSSQTFLVTIIDWFIWLAFFLEFVLKFIVEKKKISWLITNWLDSIVSIIVIISPVLEYFFTFASGTVLLRLSRLSRLTRLTRLTRLVRFLRLIRLIALGSKIQHGWKSVNLKVYVAFFFILGVGFTGSFIATGFQHSSIDVTWISLFVSTFGVFYAVLISFFVVHIWSKYNSISSQMGQEVNSLRNVFLLTRQLPGISEKNTFSKSLARYLETVVQTLWQKEVNTGAIHEKFLSLLEYFNQIIPANKTDIVILDNIVAELRVSSSAQANLINLISEKTPKILWILLIILSTVLVGSFIFLGFKNQLLATILISLVSAVTGLVVALIFDIDTPLQAGFWSIRPDLYLDLKKFILSI